MPSLWVKFRIWKARSELRQVRADFYFDLAITLEDKVPLFTTIRKYEIRARKRAPHQVRMYLEMLRGLETGSFAKAMEGIAPVTEMILLDSLQHAGDAGMADGLKFLASTVEKLDAMILTARKAIIYPLFLLVLFASLLTGFAIGVVPSLTAILPPDQWPPMGKLLYAVSMLITHHGVLIVVLFALLVALFIYSLPRWVGPVRRKLDNYFPYSFYRDYSGAMLIVALSSLMRSGVSLRSSLESCLKYGDPWLRLHLQKILKKLSSATPVNFGEAFQTGVMSEYLEDRVQDAAERRNPIEAFIKIGIGSIDRVILSIESSAKKINNVMIILCGLILMFMMSAFFGTAMEIQNGIRQSAQRATQTK